MGEYYKNDVVLLEQTKATFIHDMVDGRKAKISMAMAIDMLEPCNWDFVGAVATLLRAIGEELNPERPYVCLQRNLRLSHFNDRLEVISNTLGVFWKGNEPCEKIDRELLASLGQAKDVKRWLTASMDKTMRLQLKVPSDFWLDFS